MLIWGTVDLLELTIQYNQKNSTTVEDNTSCFYAEEESQKQKRRKKGICDPVLTPTQAEFDMFNYVSKCFQPILSLMVSVMSMIFVNEHSKTNTKREGKKLNTVQPFYK